jgi:hypothetical protein
MAAKKSHALFQVILTDPNGNEAMDHIATSLAQATGFVLQWNSRWPVTPSRTVASVRRFLLPSVFCKPLPESATVRIVAGEQDKQAIRREERRKAKLRAKERISAVS